MAIQNRRGNEADFLAGKMLPGEFAVSVDEHILRLCFGNGVVRQVALTEDLEAAIAELSEDLSGDITLLQTSNNHILQEISTLKSTSNAHGDALTNHNNRITSLESRTDGYVERISALEHDVGGQVATNTQNISILQGQIAANSQNIGTLQGQVGINTQNIGTLQGQMGEMSQKVEDMESKDVVWSFTIDSNGHLIETVERYDPTNTVFALEEGRLMVTYG